MCDCLGCAGTCEHVVNTWFERELGPQVDGEGRACCPTCVAPQVAFTVACVSDLLAASPSCVERGIKFPSLRPTRSFARPPACTARHGRDAPGCMSARACAFAARCVNPGTCHDSTAPASVQSCCQPPSAFEPAQPGASMLSMSPATDSTVCTVCKVTAQLYSRCSGPCTISRLWIWRPVIVFGSRPAGRGTQSDKITACRKSLC